MLSEGYIGMDKLDVVVIGAGVIGLAVARALALAGRDVMVLAAKLRRAQPEAAWLPARDGSRRAHAASRCTSLSRVGLPWASKLASLRGP